MSTTKLIPPGTIKATSDVAPFNISSTIHTEKTEMTLPPRAGEISLRVRSGMRDTSQTQKGDLSNETVIESARSPTKKPLCSGIPRGGGVPFLNGIKCFYSVGARLWHWLGESVVRCWTILFVSILIEIRATTLIKIASDKSNLFLMSYAMSLFVASLFGFALSLKKIEVSVAYAVWSAVGTAVVSVAGIIMFGEKCNPTKITSLILIILGVVGLNLQDGEH